MQNLSGKPLSFIASLIVLLGISLASVISGCGGGGSEHGQSNSGPNNDAKKGSITLNIALDTTNKAVSGTHNFRVELYCGQNLLEKRHFVPQDEVTANDSPYTVVNNIAKLVYDNIDLSKDIDALRIVYLDKNDNDLASTTVAGDNFKDLSQGNVTYTSEELDNIDEASDYGFFRRPYGSPTPHTNQHYTDVLINECGAMTKCYIRPGLATPMPVHVVDIKNKEVIVPSADLISCDNTAIEILPYGGSTPSPDDARERDTSIGVDKDVPLGTKATLTAAIGSERISIPAEVARFVVTTGDEKPEDVIDEPWGYRDAYAEVPSGKESQVIVKLWKQTAANSFELVTKDCLSSAYIDSDDSDNGITYKFSDGIYTFTVPANAKTTDSQDTLERVLTKIFIVDNCDVSCEFAIDQYEEPEALYAVPDGYHYTEYFSFGKWHHEGEEYDRFHMWDKDGNEIDPADLQQPAAVEISVGRYFYPGGIIGKYAFGYSPAHYYVRFDYDNNYFRISDGRLEAIKQTPDGKPTIVTFTDSHDSSKKCQYSVTITQ